MKTPSRYFAILYAVTLGVLSSSCAPQSAEIKTERVATAERYFRGVYACDSAVVDELAADTVVVSYPIFEALFGESSLRGRKKVKAFADRFCTRWLDAEIVVEDMIHEDDAVVMLWSFEATNNIPGEDGSPPSHTRESWGGITIIGFDANGKIVLELGEESRPGPVDRLQQ